MQSLSSDSVTIQYRHRTYYPPSLPSFIHTRNSHCSNAPTRTSLHSPLELAHDVVDAGAVALMVLCIQEPEVSLKRVCASALSDVCKHTAELAQQVVDVGAVSYLVPLIQHKDEKLKRQVLSDQRANGWLGVGG